MASLSDAAILEQYKLARDALVAAIVNGDNMTSFTVRGREFTCDSPNAALELCERMIRLYQSQTDAAAGTSRRNYAQLRR